jgi:zinc D-Ala-D-Ala carboxypeptidase
MKYFTYDGDPMLACPCCGRRGMDDMFLCELDELRELMGIPLIVSSGYRCAEYNKKRGFTQTHASGKAVDIQISNPNAHRLVKYAFNLGFLGIGWNQKGPHNKRFVHLDKARKTPTIWSY